MRIRDFLQIRDCSGSDCGHGDGSGDGAGDGAGYGSGSGLGYGLCSGDGAGYGYGYGDGSGYGFSNGSGDVSGNRSYRLKAISMFCGKQVHMIDGICTIIDHVKGNIARGRILRDDLTTEPCYVVRQDWLFAHGSDLHKAMEALRDKLLENLSEEERIEEFIKLTENAYGGDVIRNLKARYLG